MKKINKKGFAIAEVLAVAVVVMVIFMTVYSNFFPTTAAFEKRIEYNDVESLYATYYMRKIYNDIDFNIDDSTTYITLYDGENCQKLSGNLLTKCNNIATAFGIKEMIVTKNNIESAKEGYTTGNLAKYMSYLPNYSITSTTKEEYRLIIKTSTGYATSLLKYTKPLKANLPKLSNYMLPVYYDDDGNIFVADETNKNNSWYDYDQTKWANAVTIKDDYKNNYFDSEGKIIASTNTLVEQDQINTMWVWIPRYKYTIFNYNSDGTDDASIQIINISFENETESTGTITCEDNFTGDTSEKCYYKTDDMDTKVEIKNNKVNDLSVNGNASYTHPAFTFGDTELSGIWVGKFENSLNNSNITIIPNASPYASTYAYQAYTKNLEIDDSIYTSNTIDTHIIKNSEWGAITYLTLSKYGIYNNGLTLNGDKYISNEKVNSKNIKYSETKTSDLTSKQYSTTQNLYGIYDMVGGVAELTVTGLSIRNDGITLYSSNYSSDTNSYYSLVSDSKYYNMYLYNENYTDATIKIGKLGDATKEVSWYDSSYSGWYAQGMRMIYGNYYTTLARGCVRDASSKSCSSSSTIMYGLGVSGESYIGTGSRAVLLVSPDGGSL